MSFYENVFIARQDISAQQADALADQFTKVIEDQGGKVAKREYWGLRTLAYRIKKNRKGHYMLFNVDAPSDAVHEMERQMRLHEDVLRYMTIRVDELEEEPSIVMQTKNSRDSRDDRPRGRGGRDGGRFGGRDRDDRGRGRDDRPRDDRPREDRPAPAEKTEGGDQ